MSQHWHSGSPAAHDLYGGPGLNATRPAELQPLLQSPGEVSLAWVQRVLCFYDTTLPPVASLQQRPLVSAPGITSSLLQLEFSDGREPWQLLLRIAAAQDDSAAALMRDCERELAACRELYQHHSCRVPKVIFSALEGGLLNVCLQYDDLRGGRCALAVEDDLAQLRAVLRELAGLHGCFIGASPASAPEWLLRLRHLADDAAAHYRSGLQQLLPLLAQRWSAEELSLLQQLQPLVAGWHCYERQALSFTHGAASLDNALLWQQGDKCSAALIHWQRSGLRSPMYDVACLLVTELSPAVRRRNERSLLEEYRRQFEQAGRHYSADELEQDYRFNLCAPLLNTVIDLGRGQVPAGDAALRTLGRCLQAASDWRSVALVAARLRHGHRV